MRAALIDADGYVLNVIVVDDYNAWPGCIPAETSGNPGDWWNGTEFIIIWDPRHPKYTGPYIPPT